MQNRNDSNSENSRNNATSQLSPLGYCIAGFAMIIVLFLFGRLLLLLAIIGGIVWLIWKFRWALLYLFWQINKKITALAQAYQQKCQKERQTQQFHSAEYSNPFQTSRQYQQDRSGDGWNTGSTGRSGRRNVIFDVTPDKEDN